MNKIKCLTTRKFTENNIDYLKSKLSQELELIIPKDYSEEYLLSEANKNDVEILLGTIPSSNFLEKSQTVKLVQIPWNGIDSILKPENLRRDVVICNSHSNSKITAELAVSLMLSLIKWIPLHDKSLRENNWRKPGGEFPFLSPELLSGKKIGLIGYGRIGFEISKMLSGFDVEIEAINKSGLNKFNSNVTVKNLDYLNEILSNSDIVFVALPLTHQTENLISEKQIKVMKDSAYLINVSRGKILNETDFYNALKNKNIAGAAIDTWYQYPKRGENVQAPSIHPFGELDNVVLSPHRGGYAKGLLPHFDEVIENINNYCEGKSLKNIIDLGREY